MTPQEKIEIVPMLEDSREEFLASVHGVSKAQACEKPLCTDGPCWNAPSMWPSSKSDF